MLNCPLMAGMKIAWYGTATLMLACGNTRILIDPYLRQYQRGGAPLPLRELSAADAVLITHPHLDHFADIGAFLEAGAKEVYVSENGIAHAAAQGIRTEAMHPLAAGDTFRVGEMTVRAFQSRHCRFDLWTVLSVALSPRTYLHAKDAVSLLKQTGKWKIKDDIFAFEISGGGKRVVVLGSAGMDEGTEYPKDADLLVFPYQGRAGMHRYMKRFLQCFRPKAVMLDHFDDAFPPLTHTIGTRKFVPSARAFDRAMRAWVPEMGVWYEV
ncbi:MAG: hypothetical protein DBX60_01360 [Bacillota bacterium]|nr:MAG: hypothetical protein DBX60_01360 [Bacillota bacterium]